MTNAVFAPCAVQRFRYSSSDSRLRFWYSRSSMSRHLNAVGNLLERHSFALQPLRAEPAALAEHDAWPRVFRQGYQHGTGQHVAAVGLLVAQHAVEQQVDGLAVVNAQQRRILARPPRDRLTRFSEVDVRGQVRERNTIADVAALIEQRRV